MFIVYSMDGCNYCEKVKQLMELTKQTHVVYTLGQHFSIQAFEDEFGTKQFPQVVVDVKEKDERKVIGGAAELAEYFKKNSLV